MPRDPGGGPARKAPEELRSYRWFGGDEPTALLRTFGHRSRMRGLGYAAGEHIGKPVIGILNTWSEINPCHMHLRERAEQVKRGVWQAGGFPLEFPVATLSETYQKPTPMMYRNLLAMETEELLRSYPIDGAVLMGGCDKTTPALLMGAASAGIPAIYLPAGPMLRGHFRGQPVGSGTDVWKYWDDYRAGLIGDCELAEIECGIARSPGHCMTMGTASTMTSAAEALGMTLPGAASIPAVDSAHHRMASATGARIVDMVGEDLSPAAHPDPRGVRGRRGDSAGPGRVDQRAHPPHRDGGPLRRAAHPGRLRRDRPPRAGACQHPAERRVPDGGLLLRGRAARPARPARRRPRGAAPPAAHRGRPHARRADRRRARLPGRRHPLARRPPCPPKAGSRCCTATSPRTER